MTIPQYNDILSPMKERGPAKRFFNRLAILFMVTITVTFLMYAATIIHSSAHLARRERVLQEQEMTRKAANLIKNILDDAATIIAQINEGRTFQPLQFSLLDASALDTRRQVDIVNELTRLQGRTGNLAIRTIALFADESDIVYTSAGFVHLGAPFPHVSYPRPYLTVASLGEELNLPDGQLHFTTPYLLYFMGFRHQGGTERGVAVVCFDPALTTQKLDEIFGNIPYQVRFQQKTLFGTDLTGTKGLTVSDDFGITGLSLSVAYPSFRYRLTDPIAVLSLLFGGILFLTTTLLSFAYARQYFRPLKEISSIVRPGADICPDEFSSLVESLEGMVVENETYKKDISHLKPFADRGILHGLAVGGMSDTDLSSSLRFLRPCYIVIAINIDTQDADVYVQAPEVFEKLRAVFATDKQQLTYYRRDIETWFVCINADVPPKDEETADRIRLLLTGLLPAGATVTIGIDQPRTNLGEFRESCNSALRALNRMLVQGKGEIYYATEDATRNTGYYFAPDLSSHLGKLIEHGDVNGIHELYEAILRKNLMKYDLDADAVHDLSSMLFSSLDAVLRSRGQRASKANTYSTIEEVFSHYEKEAVDACGENAETKTQGKVDAMLAYTDEHYRSMQISQKWLAHEFGLSVKTVSTAFLRRRGTTYLSYVSTLRINKAKELLISSHQPVSAIARACGYTSDLSFRRNFEAQTGFSPAEFRKEMQKKKTIPFLNDGNF